MGELNKDKEAPPLYAQIAEEIRDKIKSGEWEAGDKIPAEVELCDFYNVSRITVRKAIEQLVFENLLRRERAKGTFVLEATESKKQEHFTYARGFTKEMAEMGKRAVTLKAEIKLISANDFLASKLNINAGDKVIELTRVRGVNNKGFVYFKTYFSYDDSFSLEANDYYQSFYDVLKSKGIVVDEITEYIEASKPTQEVIEHLNIDENEPILVRVRVGSQKNTDFVEYTECYYIGSEYRYYIDFT